MALRGRKEDMTTWRDIYLWVRKLALQPSMYYQVLPEVSSSQPVMKHPQISCVPQLVNWYLQIFPFSLIHLPSSLCLPKSICHFLS